MVELPSRGQSRSADTEAKTNQLACLYRCRVSVKKAGISQGREEKAGWGSLKLKDTAQIRDALECKGVL